MSPSPAWRLARIVHRSPQGNALHELAEADARRLGASAVLTGHRLHVQGAELGGEIEGYVWAGDGSAQAARAPFARAWSLRWQAPPRLTDAADWRLTLTPDPAGRKAPRAMVRLELLLVCGPQSDLIAAFNALARGEAGAQRRLRQYGRACGEPPQPLLTTAFAPDPAGGQTLTTVLRPAWFGHTAPPGQGDRVKRLIVVASHPVAEGAPEPGAQLLAAVRQFFIYVPED